MGNAYYNHTIVINELTYVMVPLVIDSRNSLEIDLLRNM